jgi:hypothetical protein
MTSIIKVDQIQLADGTAPTAADLGLNTSGSVLQVKHGYYSAEITNSTENYVNSGLSLTITPSSASSSVLVLVNQQIKITSDYDQGMGLRILRDGSIIWTSTTKFDEYVYDGTTTVEADTRGRKPVMWLDSPATTSAVTYSVQGALHRDNYNAQGKFQDNGNYSFITLMEIAG